MVGRTAYWLVIASMIWTVLGYTVVSFASLCGFGALPVAVLWMIAMISLWSEDRHKPAPKVARWRIWAVWMFALLFLLVPAALRFYEPSAPAPAWWDLVIAMAGVESDRTILLLRSAHQIVAAPLLAWAGYELARDSLGRRSGSREDALDA